MSFVSSKEVPGEIPCGAVQQKLVDTHFQEHVGQWRDVYDEALVDGAIYQKRQEIVLGWIDELAMPAGEKVLEIGCGGGRCAVALAQRGHLVHAIDSVPGMLDSTQQLAVQAGVRSSVSIGLGDAHNLAFRDGSFGLVLSIGVIPYLHSPQKALGEMARVLRPGGFLLITAGNRWRLNHLLDPWLSPPLQPAKKAVGVIRRRFRKPWPESPGPPLRLDSLRELELWLSAVGLAKIKAGTVGFPPLTFHYRPIFGEGASITSIRLNNWLQRLADRNVPGIRSSGMDHIALARKPEERERRSK
jgi:ubiquinone/menaquinone biosynthesis C-methylase UbiE